MNTATSCAGGRAPRGEETGGPLQDLVGPFKFTNLLLEHLQLCRVARARPRHMTLIDVGLAHPGAHRLGTVAELLSNPLNRAVLGAQLGTQRPNHSYRCCLLLRAGRRVVGFPGVVSFGTSPSSFPNDGDSNQPRAVHSHRRASLEPAAVRLCARWLGRGQCRFHPIPAIVQVEARAIRCRVRRSRLTAFRCSRAVRRLTATGGSDDAGWCRGTRLEIPEPTILRALSLGNVSVGIAFARPDAGVPSGGE